jgi:hypothetical protein
MKVGLVNTRLSPLLASALLGACATIIGVSGYEIDPSLDPPSEGGEGGASEGGTGATPNGGQQAAEGGAGTGTGGADGEAGASEGGAPAGGVGGAGACAEPCDDAIACTVDSCNAQGTCVHTPDDTLCDADPGECVVCQAGIGCVASQEQVVQLLIDPAFDELSLVWEEFIFDHPLQEADGIVQFDGAAHTPDYSAWWMAVEFDATIQGYADLLQPVTIPAGTRELTVSGFYEMYAGITDPASDYVQAGLFTPGGTVALLTFHEWAGSDPDAIGWTAFEHAAPANRLQAVVGQDVTFDLFGETWDTTYYFDSLQLEATVCQ